MRRGTSCSNPLLGAVLALLFACPHAGLAMPAVTAEAGDLIVDGVAAGAKVLGGKHRETLRSFIKGFKWGNKAHKAFDDINHNKQSPDAGAVGFVSIAGGPPVLVLTADITSTAVVRIVGFGCATATPVPMVYTSISLLGHVGTVLLGDLYRAPYLPCSEVPNVGRGRPLAVLGLGRGGELSARFPTFSYIVSPMREGPYTWTQVWLGPVQPQQRGGGQYPPRTIRLSADSRYPSRYYVQITGIRVGRRMVPMSQPGAVGTIGERVHLSTDWVDTFTYLQSLQYNHLKLALQSQFFPNVMPVTLSVPVPQRREQLCYSAGAVAWPSLPPIALVFAGDVVMDVAASNLWYNEGPNICLAILPAKDDVSVLGSFLQRGRLMTISTQNDGISTLKFV